MVYENTLMPGTEYRIPNAATITPEHIQNLIQQKAVAYGVPVAFKTDYMATNRIFRLLGEKNEVLVLFNPETDSGRYVFQFSRQGTYLFAQVNRTNGWDVSSGAAAAAEAASSCYPGYNHWHTIVEDIIKEVFA